MRKTSNGFTIVELLIVIVVIGILAAITIVAYSGFTARAENAKTTNSVAAYIKALTIYGSDNSLYPQYNYPCLGAVSYCANMTDTAGGCEGSGRASDHTPLTTALNSTAGTLPAPSTQSMDCGGKQYSGAYYAYTGGGKNAGIRFYLRGQVSCPPVGGSTTTSVYQQTQTTVCHATLPSLP
jgi:prepilin-type N-terminal cleavage/methylation domain-containing protein